VLLDVGGVEANFGVRDDLAPEDIDHAFLYALSRDLSRLGSFPHQFPH
jgi:hypothetical protein